MDFPPEVLCYIILIGSSSLTPQVVMCSVHLHPPQMFRRRGISYKEYLNPLQKAIESVAGVKDGTLQTPCLLLGDFNIEPKDFKKSTAAIPFWQQHLGQEQKNILYQTLEDASLDDLGLRLFKTWWHCLQV